MIGYSLILGIFSPRPKDNLEIELREYIKIMSLPTSKLLILYKGS